MERIVGKVKHVRQSGGGNRWAGFGRWRCGRDVSHQAGLKKLGKNPLSQSLFVNISKTIVDRYVSFSCDAEVSYAITAAIFSQEKKKIAGRRSS